MSKVMILVLLELLVIKCESRPAASPVVDDLELKSPELERNEFVRMAGYGEDKLSTVLITGVVVCNHICLHAHHLRSHSSDMMPVSGALVGIACHGSNIQKKQTKAKAVTDEYGEFVIDLPSHLHALQGGMEKSCSVKVLQLPKNSLCHRSAFATRPRGIRLSSVGNGVRTYTTGRISFCMKRQEEDEQNMSW